MPADPIQLDIQGVGTVEVSPSFLSLPIEQQHATVKHIFGQVVSKPAAEAARAAGGAEAMQVGGTISGPATTMGSTVPTGPEVPRPEGVTASPGPPVPLPETRGVVARTVEGFKQGFGERELGLPADVRAENPSIAPFQPLIGGADAVMRSISGLMSATPGTVAGLAEQAGMSRANADRLERDLNILAKVAAVVPGAPGAGVPRMPAVGPPALERGVVPATTARAMTAEEIAAAGAGAERAAGSATAPAGKTIGAFTTSGTTEKVINGAKTRATAAAEEARAAGDVARAEDLSARADRLDILHGAVKDAREAKGPFTRNLGKEFEKIAADPERMKLFPAQEQEAIKKLAEGGGFIERQLRETAKAGPRSGEMTTGKWVYGIMHPVGMAKALFGGEASQQLAAALIKRNLRQLETLISSGVQ